MNRRAFTLVELLIVITIVATVAAIAAPSIHDSVKRAKEAQLKANLKLIREAVDRFRLETGMIPVNLEDLTKSTRPARVYADKWPLQQQLTNTRMTYNGPYLHALPKDPITGNSFSNTVTEVNGRPFINIFSTSTAISSEGTAYNTW